MAVSAVLNLSIASLDRNDLQLICCYGFCAKLHKS